MNLTAHRWQTRFMATEVEHINRLLATRDISQAKAKLRCWRKPRMRPGKHNPDCTIKFGINAGRAWFSVL